MRRRCLLVPTRLAATIGLLCVAFPAAASAPVIETQPAGTETRISEACQFPVREEVRFQQTMVQFFVTRGGDVALRLSGSFTGTLTHVLPGGADGPSVRINFSGPGVLDPVTGGLVARGTWLLESPDDPSTSAYEGFLVLTRGLVDVGTDPDTGVLSLDSTRGTVTDLCAALA